MEYPNFSEEKKLWKKGYKCVVGLDEAGRGPIAGPVVAAAVLVKCHSGLDPESRNKENAHTLDSRFPPRLGEAGRGNNSGVNDSKQLSEKQREYFYKVLTNHPDIKWGIGRVSEKTIDKINILQASKLAMRKAIVDLHKNLQRNKKNKGTNCCQISSGRLKSDDSYFLLIDGNFSIPSRWLCHRGSSINFLNLSGQKSVIKGDRKVFSISAASIIAKVTRDRIMAKYQKKYPAYGFDRHKGYPTKAHFVSLKKFGPCKIHRRSFHPVTLSTG